MKHLKLFESNEQSYWLYIYYIKEDGSISVDLFPDKESCELAILNTINDERENFEGEDEYTDDKFFTEVEEAIKWYEHMFDDVEIRYEEVTLHEKQIPSEKMKMLRDAKKYNL